MMATPNTGFELREHTADVALYVWGDRPEDLFASAADGFYAALGQLEPAGQPLLQPYEIILTAPDRADLLADFLSELLFVFASRHARLAELQFPELTESYLRATGRLQPLEMERSTFDGEVKAITRHNLAIKTSGGRLETTIILDI
jgi:SHS2 domain-containing protein